MQQLIDRFQNRQSIASPNALNSPSAHLQAIREKCFESFKQKGLPRVKDELWRYTSPLPFTDWLSHSINQDMPQQVDQVVKVKGDVEEKSGLAVWFDEASGQVWINEKYKDHLQFKYWAEIDSFSGARSEDLKEVLQQSSSEDGFYQVNRLFFARGGVLFVEGQLDQPIRLSFGSSPSFAPARFCIIAEANAELSVIEEHSGNSDSDAANFPVVQVFLKENAKLQHLKLIQSMKLHFSVTEIYLDKFACSNFLQLLKETELARSAIYIVQQGERAESHLDGLALLEKNQKADVRFEVRHKEPYGSSRQLYKAALKDRTQSIFNGKVFIAQGAQKVDSSQLNKNLIMSAHAEADSKPELEVYADDVKAAHGASIGQLNEDELFYLCSRGIAKDLAKQMLTEGYVIDLVDRLTDDYLRATASEFIRFQIGGGGL